jgi:hypothetical protein
MVEGPVPADMQEEVETRRAELVERVSEVSTQWGVLLRVWIGVYPSALLGGCFWWAMSRVRPAVWRKHT